ncbi:unnamed protein product [Ilex paraguariensis]|uniref:Uncharacterized protein n=1 Tax=Ilex paraguariensis TaxID=185542 RepID=A0ABC8R1D9_9AQUA
MEHATVKILDENAKVALHPDQSLPIEIATSILVPQPEAAPTPVSATPTAIADVIPILFYIVPTPQGEASYAYADVALAPHSTDSYSTCIDELFDDIGDGAHIPNCPNQGKDLGLPFFSGLQLS